MEKTGFKSLIDEIAGKQNIEKSQIETILNMSDDERENIDYLYHKARTVADEIYGKDVYVRGLIEFTNYCRNDCLYCGIRRSNGEAQRYRLTEEQILECNVEYFRMQKARNDWR